MGTVRTFSGDTRRTVGSLFQYIIKRIGVAHAHSGAFLQDAINISDMPSFQGMIIGCYPGNLIMDDFGCFPFISICRNFRQYRFGCTFDFLLHDRDVGHFAIVLKINHTAVCIVLSFFRRNRMDTIHDTGNPEKTDIQIRPVEPYPVFYIDRRFHIADSFHHLDRKSVV